MLKYSEIPSRRQERPKRKWPHINAGRARRKILALQNATGQRTLGTLHTILNETGKKRLIKYINNVDINRSTLF